MSGSLERSPDTPSCKREKCICVFYSNCISVGDLLSVCWWIIVLQLGHTQFKYSLSFVTPFLIIVISCTNWIVVNNIIVLLSVLHCNILRAKNPCEIFEFPAMPKWYFPPGDPTAGWMRISRCSPGSPGRGYRPAGACPAAKRIANYIPGGLMGLFVRLIVVNEWNS